MKSAFYENKSKPYTASVQNILTTSPHFHKEIELVYVMRGACVAHADRNCVPLSEGDLFISFPNQIHYYEACQVGEYYVGIVSSDMLYALKDVLYDHIPKQCVVHIGDDPILCGYVLDTLNKAGEYRKTRIAGDFLLLMSGVLPRLTLAPRTHTDNGTLKAVLEYCAEHYASTLTLDDMAEALHISRYHLSHLLNSKLGMGFNGYLNTLRINQACELLEETEKKTADISEDVGFGSIRSFNRAFLQMMNMTPLQYRAVAKGRA